MLRQIRFALVALAAIPLSSCGGEVDLPAGRNVSFDPIAFFKGHTHGEGELSKLFSKPVHVSVDSVGRPAAGGLILDQMIWEQGKPPSSRRWVIQRVNQGKFSATLTDAVGPVSGSVSGRRAEIVYKMRNGLKVEQRLEEEPGDKTVLNRLTVHKLGVQVASLTETITKATP